MYASEAAEQDDWLPKLYFARHWEDRTLTDDECNSAVQKAIAAAEKLGAELRS